MHILRSMNKQCKILGHLARLHCSNTCCLKLLGEIQESFIVIQLSPANKDLLKFLFTTKVKALYSYTHTNSKHLQGSQMRNNIPVCKTSWPSKDRSYAVCAGFTTFLINPVMSSYSTVGCLCFNSFSIWAHLNSYNTGKLKYRVACPDASFNSFLPLKSLLWCFCTAYFTNT